MKGRSVVVEEPGKVWTGLLLAVKPSSVSGPWAEVLADDGYAWTVPLRFVRFEDESPEKGEGELE